MFDRFLNFINDNFIRLYWKTLRLNRLNKDEWKGKKNNSWFHRGTSLVCVITTKCNLKCLNYCPMFIDDGRLVDGQADKYPKYEISTLEEWKKYFENFPQWLSQIYISGGEPTLVPYLSDLINWLIERGHHVCLFSNLKFPERLYGVKKHWRFVIIPTFHKGYDNKERYSEAVKNLNDKVRLIPYEMTNEHDFDYTTHKNLYTPDWFMNTNTLYHVGPDAPRTGKIYLGCNNLYVDGKVKK